MSQRAHTVDCPSRVELFVLARLRSLRERRGSRWGRWSACWLCWQSPEVGTRFQLGSTCLPVDICILTLLEEVVWLPLHSQPLLGETAALGSIWNSLKLTKVKTLQKKIGTDLYIAGMSLLNFWRLCFCTGAIRLSPYNAKNVSHQLSPILVMFISRLHAHA